MRHLIIALAAITLVSCSGDPAYQKQKYLDSGKKYLEQKRYKEASIMFRKAIEKDRKFGMAYYELALVNIELQLVQDAYQNLRRADELLNPKLVAMDAMLADAKKKANDPETFEPTLQDYIRMAKDAKAKDNGPEADDARLKLCEILLLAAQSNTGGDNSALTKEVRQKVGELLASNPNNWQGHKLSGDLALIDVVAKFRAGDTATAKREVGEAVQEYRTALTGKPGDYTVSLALARTLVLDGEAAEAETLFKALIAKDKSNENGYLELYTLYVGQKKLPEAEGILKSAIAAVPKDANLRLRLAQFYFGTKRNDELVALLNDMKKDLKMFPQAYIQAGDFFLRVNQPDSAIKEYEAGIKNDSDNKNNYLKKEIEVYIRQNNMVMAQSKNDQILHNDPKDPEAKGLKATFMLDHGQIAEAMGDLQTVVTARPNNWVARFNLGRAYFAQGKFEQARQEFDKCIDLNAGYLPARYAQTQVAIIRGDFDAASHDADEILKLQPNNVQGRVMKAAALQRLNKYDEARKLLNEVLEKNPNQEETLLELGVLDLNQKRTKDALDHFSRAYKAQPQNIRGLLGQSKALLMDGQIDKSVAVIKDASQAGPPSLEMQRELGNSQMAARQFDAAIATYQALIGNSGVDMKNKGDLWSRIGEAYRYKGDYPKSIEFMELAAKALPDNAAIATNLALLYEAGKDLARARTNYERALKIDAKNPLALNNLAYLITETNGDLTTAMSYATQAKQQLPNFLEVSDTIGWIYLKKNNPDGAVEEFKRLVAQAPANAIYHYHYAMALQQKGDVTGAKAECEVALLNRPQKDLADEIHALQSRLK